MPAEKTDGCTRCGGHAQHITTAGDLMCTSCRRTERRILAAATTSRQIESERERRAAWQGCH